MATNGIKTKIGVCIDCGPGSKPKPLTAGRCQTHYWPYRASLKNNTEANKAKIKALDEMEVFMAAQYPLIPKYCENGCGAILTKQGIGGYKTHIAHILPKSKFESVKTHPQNRWFACGDCHTNYDQKGNDFQKIMPVAPVVIDRFKEFMHFLNPREIKALPVWLYDILIENS